MSNNFPQAHDKYFKHALSNPEVAKEFLTAFLPKHMLEKIDLSKLECQPGTYIDPDLVDRYSDVVFSVGFNQEHTAYLYVLIEHQSTADPDIVFRTLGYSMRFMLDHAKKTGINKFPVLFPFVYYHGKDTPYPYSLNWEEAFESGFDSLTRTLTNPLHLIDLNQISEQSLRSYQWLYGVAVTMKYIRDPNLASWLTQGLEQMSSLPTDSTVIDLILSTIYYVINRSDSIDMDQIKEEILPHLPKPAQEGVMTLAERLRIEGREEGREEGCEETLVKIATLKFGGLTIDIENQIRQASKDELDQLTVNLLSAKNAEDWLSSLKHV